MKSKFKFIFALFALLCLSNINVNEKKVEAAIGTTPAVRYSSELSSTYYNTVSNLKGDALLEGLAVLSQDNHKYFTSYDEIRGGNVYSDQDPNNPNNFIDFYTGWSIPGDWDSGSTWNREHVWCQSLSGGLYGTSRGAGADIHHIRPLISSINSARNNGLYTDRKHCGSITLTPYTYNGGEIPSHKGELTGCYNSGNQYWEVKDDTKGDVARILLYLYMHYSTEVEANTSYSYAGKMDIGNIVYTSKGTDKACFDMLVEWNELDPVDTFEVNRNNYCASVTGVRNPFIDHPEYVEDIWGDAQTSLYNYELSDLMYKYYNNGTYQIKTEQKLNEEALKDVKTFINNEASLQLDKTTYYNKNAVLYGDFIGTFEKVNYGETVVTTDNIAKVKTDTSKQVNVGDNVSFTLNDDKKTVTYKDVIVDTPVTLKDFLSEYFISNDWKYAEAKGYYHEVVNYGNDKYAKDFLEILTPLLLNDYSNSNYFTVDEIVIKDEESFLNIKVYLDKTNIGYVDNEELLLSEARVYKGVKPFDEANPVTENIITFNLGADGNATHDDASGGATTTYTEKVDDYTLSITNCSSVYSVARDAKGNSCLKLGTSSKTATLTISVPSDVTKVIIYIAQYKSNATKVTINGTTHTITTPSNNGEYTPIEIDTTQTKTITLSTVSGACRAMINTIEFVIE